MRHPPGEDVASAGDGHLPKEAPVAGRTDATCGSGPSTGRLGAAELEVEAPDLELLVGVRGELDVLLHAVVLVGLDHGNPRQVLEEDLGDVSIRLPPELLVHRETGRVPELVELGLAPVVHRAAGSEQAPHHAVWVAEGGGRIGPPEAFEALFTALLGAHRVLD